MNKESADILTGIARGFSERITGVVGAKNVRTVFLAGSLAKGEVASCQLDAGVEIYSDIDLYVVLRDSAAVAALRARISEVVDGTAGVPERYRVMSTPDIGLFDEAGLLAQPARPGTVDTAAHRVELQGESMGAKLSKRFTPEAIDPREALYLLENRLLEIGDAWAAAAVDSIMADARARQAAYITLKAAADVATAVLIVERAYVSLRRERIRRFNAEARRIARQDLLSEDAVRCVNECSAALDDLDAALTGLVDSELRSRVESLLVEAWTSIAGRLFEKVPNIAALLNARAAGASQSVNVRELMIMGKRLGHNRLRLAIGALPTSRVSPIDALRMAGLMSVLAVDSPVLTALDRMTRLCGFNDGSVLERARAMRFALERT